LQDKEIRRVGGNESISVDMRVLAATNKHLEELIAQNAFREDLYYRLSVIPIEIAPLRERVEDILPLVTHFLRREIGNGKELPALKQDFVNCLEEYSWPGNVRELEHVIEGSLTLAKGLVVGVDDLSGAVRGILATASLYKQEKSSQSRQAVRENRRLKESLREQEREAIERALLAGGSVSGAARILGVPRQTLQYRIKVLRIDGTSFA